MDFNKILISNKKFQIKSKIAMKKLKAIFRQIS